MGSSSSVPENVVRVPLTRFFLEAEGLELLGREVQILGENGLDLDLLAGDLPGLALRAEVEADVVRALGELISGKNSAFLLVFPHLIVVDQAHPVGGFRSGRDRVGFLLQSFSLRKLSLDPGA